MSTYEISKSSLLSLKAEILRKQEELGKTKAENEVKIRNLKKNAPLDFKNKGVEQRQGKDLTEEEENLLKKSREALEAKSKLYDKLANRKSKLTEEQAEHCRRYLVRFDRKSRVPDLPPEDSDNDVDRYPDSEDEGPRYYEPPKHRDEEWVEYVDCLGRTRTCLRKDLDYLKSKDKDLKLIVDEKRRNRGKSRSKTPERPPEPEIASAKPELTEDNELLSNDMRRELFRRQWEKEEEELKKKTDIHYQDLLFSEARTHGVGYYGFSKDEEERAKQQDALKKLRAETKDQQKKSDTLRSMREKQLAARVKAAQNRKRERMGLPPMEDEPEPAPQPEPPQPQTPEISDKEKKKEDKRKKHVRPWDLGKEGVKKHYEYSQEEWVDKKRKERPSEFAPPSYRREHRSKEKRYNTDSEDEDNKTLRFTTKRQAPSAPPRGFRAAPIVNEVDDALLADYRVISEAPKRGKRAEIAPPSTYDYYGSNTKKRTNPELGNVSESIEAGLKYLRAQLERKQTSSRDEDMFLS